MSYNMYLLTVLVIVLSLIVSAIIVLVLGVKVGAYLEGRREVVRLMNERRAAHNAWADEENRKDKIRRDKHMMALAHEEDDVHFKKWEAFYNELH